MIALAAAGLILLAAALHYLLPPPTDPEWADREPERQERATRARLYGRRP